MHTATTEGDDMIPEECRDGSYRELVGQNHQHRHFAYRLKGDSIVNENIEKNSVGFDNWFRFRLDNLATRMLEKQELLQTLVREELVCRSSSLDYV